MFLEKYNKKQNLSKTSESNGGKTVKNSEKLGFIIQKHNAMRLHYDLRLEVDGVLKSWAMPKGPSLNPEEKRLAIKTEDHTLEYFSFEGTIPEGEYGAGEVIIWDKGSYRSTQKENEREIPINEAVKNGHIEIILEGKKLKGKFSLVRIGFRGSRNSWLLIKARDQYADKTKDITSAEPQSVISGKTIEDLRKAG